MKYINFETHGIHTRLKLVISRSGGYSRKRATEYIMKKYWIEDRDIAYYLSDFVTIHKSIAEKGIGEIIRIAIGNIEDDKRKSIKRRRELNGMLMTMSPYINRFIDSYRF